MDWYKELAIAIIIQASRDYRIALQKLKRDPNNQRTQVNVDSIEQFFSSDWYKCMTEVDGEMFIRKLREEV